MIRKVDEYNITPSDFAVNIKHLPRNKTKEDIKQWINTVMEDADIKEINLAYDISKVVQAIRRLNRLKTVKNNYEFHRKKYDYEQV